MNLGAESMHTAGQASACMVLCDSHPSEQRSAPWVCKSARLADGGLRCKQCGRGVRAACMQWGGCSPGV